MLKKFTLLTVVSLLLIASASFAGPLDLMESYTLANGMQVYLLPRQVPAVTCILGYKAGAKQEWLGATGLAHYLEHSAFLGTKKYPENYLENITNENGGWSNAATNVDATMYFNELPESALPELLEFEADRMQNLTFPLEREKQELDVIQEEMRLTSENDVYGRSYDETIRSVFSDSNYSWPIIGKSGDLPQLSRDDLVRFYKENYHPNNATLIIIGGIDVAKTKALINKNFASIPAGSPTIYPRTPEPKLDGKRIRVIRGNTDLPLYSIAWLTTPKKHKDAMALQLLATVLSGGTSSRLDKRIVYDESLFSGIYAGSNTYVLNGFFNIGGMATDEASLAKAEKAIIEEIQKIATEGISTEELNTAKNMYLSSYVYKLQSNIAFAFAISNAVLTNTLDELKDLNKSLVGVSPADIQRVAKQYLSPNDYITVTILPTEDKK